MGGFHKIGGKEPSASYVETIYCSPYDTLHLACVYIQAISKHQSHQMQYCLPSFSYVNSPWYNFKQGAHIFLKNCSSREIYRTQKLVAKLLQKPDNFLFFKISPELKFFIPQKVKKRYQDLFRYKNQKLAMMSTCAGGH